MTIEKPTFYNIELDKEEVKAINDTIKVISDICENMKKYNCDAVTSSEDAGIPFELNDLKNICLKLETLQYVDEMF